MVKKSEKIVLKNIQEVLNYGYEIFFSFIIINMDGDLFEDN